MHPERVTVDIGGGQRLPIVGLGTWNVTGDDVGPAVRAAIECGYRHIDTAYGYGNEAEIGQALRDSGIDRDEVFLTSKIPPRRIGYEEETLAGSLRQLRTDYLDLWLIHAPPDTADQSSKLWEFVIRAREQGRVRAIGVSNYSTEQIDHLAAVTGVMPAVNQIRWSPALFDPSRMAQMRERSIVLEGFSAIRLTNLEDPRLVAVAAAHGVTTAQVLVHWQLQHGIVVLPRSVRADRIRENFSVWHFELTPGELALIDAMGTAS
jgi:diketogulonate reductase-like aldo/keto reductase